jgi:hypothetical protein
MSHFLPRAKRGSASRLSTKIKLVYFLGHVVSRSHHERRVDRLRACPLDSVRIAQLETTKAYHERRVGQPQLENVSNMVQLDLVREHH